ncbi:MAG: tRNA-binding protein [Mycoplasmataceae bacterium]|jgi:tRNA-binding protein|nr:tRNA-binding protein [Mycoplasmataceae bacterium]
MVTFFYNKSTLNDTLLISINNKPTIKVNSKNNFTYGVDSDNQLTFINIFECSKLLQIPEGYLFLDEPIKKLIQDNLQIDLSKYDIKTFKVGEVVKCEIIPNTHLHICKINIKNKVLPIVCGAENIALGLKVVVAQIGTIMPNGLLIKPNKLMNYESMGMICSKRELLITDRQFNDEGIIKLPNHFNVGDDFMNVYKNYLLVTKQFFARSFD